MSRGCGTLAAVEVAVPQGYEARIRALMKKLSVAQDPSLIEGLARDLLEQRPIEILAELMSTLGRMALEEHARVIYMGVCRLALAEGQLAQAVKEGVYSLLAARGEGALVRYLLPLPPLREVPDGDMPRDVELEQMTLGMRKWKARGHLRDFLAKLSKDHDPAVFRVLLDNPKVTEDDVVAWAARRPAFARHLHAIAVHRRWSLRPKVQEAVARNPYTPAHVAAAFMPLFSAQLLRTIGQDTALHPIVRTSATELLALRRSAG